MPGPLPTLQHLFGRLRGGGDTLQARQRRRGGVQRRPLQGKKAGRKDCCSTLAGFCRARVLRTQHQFCPSAATLRLQRALHPELLLPNRHPYVRCQGHLQPRLRVGHWIHVGPPHLQLGDPGRRQRAGVVPDGLIGPAVLLSRHHHTVCLVQYFSFVPLTFFDHPNFCRGGISFGTATHRSSGCVARPLAGKGN